MQINIESYGKNAPFRNKDIYENTTTIGIIYFQMVDFQIQSHVLIIIITHIFIRQ